MAEVKYEGAPFGSNCPRFSGKYLQAGSGGRLGPGSYEVNIGAFDDEAVARRASGPGWARAYETSHMIALPYLLNKEEWEKKLELRRGLGPGTYDVKDAPTDRNYVRGLLETREPRFREHIQSIAPGPGTYGKHGVPHTLIEEKSREPCGRIGMLDCGGSAGRSMPTLGARLGPGTYHLTGSIDELMMKKVGTRGPYDIFSADRGKPIIIGHRAEKKSYNLGPGQYDMKSSVDKMSAQDQLYKGEFGKGPQYPDPPIERIIVSTLSQKPRKPSDPGPGQYDAIDPSLKRQSFAASSPPFLSSAQRTDKMATKFFTGNFNPVGAGRYDVQRYEKKHPHGCQSSFKSKTDRPSGLGLRLLQDRLRPQNQLPHQRMTLVAPDEPKACH